MSLKPNRIVMEACYGSIYRSREFQNLDRSADLIPPYQVKPFVIGNMLMLRSRSVSHFA